MTLSDFIEAHFDALIADWSGYAATVNEGRRALSSAQLRTYAPEILRAIAADMRASQSYAEQRSKSHGAKREQGKAFDAIAAQHADDRLTHGFSLNDVVAEYRALRASVLRRWERSGAKGPDAFQELVRFNEAIDQGLTEAVRQFTQRTEHTRDLFAGVLAHDLRSPLGVLTNSAAVLLHDKTLSPASVRATAHLERSTTRMRSMIDDLYVFARARLGNELPINLSPQDMGKICRDAVEEMRVLYPEAVIHVETVGDLSGTWDGGRMGQLLFNLLSNAVRYGAGAILVHAVGDARRVTVSVSNEGNPIPKRALATLFDPLTRVQEKPRRGEAATGMGLGLYICRSIVTAHDGAIRVDSDASGTTFTVTFSRDESEDKPAIVV